jgi:hypothetical protein
MAKAISHRRLVTRLVSKDNVSFPVLRPGISPNLISAYRYYPIIKQSNALIFTYHLVWDY